MYAHFYRFLSFMLGATLLLSCPVAWAQTPAASSPASTTTVIVKPAATLSPATAKPIVPTQTTKPTVPPPVKLTLSFAGDCTLGEFRDMGCGGTFAEYYDIYGPAWAFGNVKQIFSADDATFVNLEGPLTNHTQVEDKEYAIKGDVRNVNCLVNGSVEVCNLANNHTLDCGQEGLEETEQVLAQAGIAACGGTGSVTFLERKSYKLAFIGLDGWDTYDYTVNALQDSMAYAKDQQAQLLVIEFHWGNEREYMHDATQEALAHMAIDLGADIVVGSHPHVLQDTEMYKGKLICYSMGNFSFGANVNPSDKDSVIIQQTFVKTPTGFQYGPTKFIPCRVSSVTTNNDFRPTPYTNQEDIDRVLTKLQPKPAPAQPAVP